MQRNHLWTGWVTGTAIALAAAGCGGGGGGSGGSDGTGVITPGAGPPPPPTASPTPPASPFGALGQTKSQEFATLGFSYRAADGGIGYSPDPASVATDRPVGLRYVSSSQQFFLSVSGFGEGVLIPNGSSGIDGQGRTTMLGYSTLTGAADLYAALHPDGGYLSSTAFGSWVSNFLASQFPYLVVEFLYGVPTANADMPTAGTGTYAALAEEGPLTVDFGGRTVSGTLAIGATSDKTTFALTGVTFTPDGTGFRGRLTAPAPGRQGEIEGRFTGPAAREMMVRAIIPGDLGTIVILRAAVRR